MTDLRLVFAPEADIAAFGGDPDNFQFPRWSLDFSFLRAYENNKPAHTPIILQIDFAGPRANQLVFVSGDPGTTARLQTRARNWNSSATCRLPISLLRASELRGRYIQFGKNNAGDERIAQAPLNSLQNGIKVRRKQLDALNDDALVGPRNPKAEQALRAARSRRGARSLAARSRAASQPRTGAVPALHLHRKRRGFSSALFRDARLLAAGPPTSA